MKYFYGIIFFFLLSTFYVCSQGVRKHIVQRGETLELIAQNNGVSSDELRKANMDMDVFYTGLEISIPAKKMVVTQSGTKRSSNSSKRHMKKRSNFWENLWMAAAGGGTFSQSTPNFWIPTIPYSGGGNMDYLLDPNYALAQTFAQQQQYNQVSENIARQTMNQIRNEEELEYQNFCRYNKKADGSNYSYSDWITLKGQAIQSMKNESVSSGGSANRDSYGHSNACSTKSKNTGTSSSGKICLKLSASDIAHCNGNGICAKCNGKKKYFDLIARWVDPCVTCNGTGKCPSCHGTGRRL